ncbi:layilin isoform X2 [Erinaceus europaeus]|uniref:Layilin isoform X2 n=1 Tax=Erinaceus europaeus TaxID=9365 RepID=A0A1S3APQ9_ERIEU|nr:layilin isoform X2 [Erinaceus europaeus]
MEGLPWKLAVGQGASSILRSLPSGGPRVSGALGAGKGSWGGRASRSGCPPCCDVREGGRGATGWLPALPASSGCQVGGSSGDAPSAFAVVVQEGAGPPAPPRKRRGVRGRAHPSRAMQLGAALRAVVLAALLAGPRGAAGRLLSGQLVCRGGTQRPCYKVIYFHDAFRRLNFEEARETCRRDGGHLVSIESEAEQRMIENLIGNLLASDGDFWIGLRRHEEKRNNSTACQDLYAWTDGSTAAFRNWYVDEPSCGSEVCVVMYHQPSATPGIGGPYMFQWNDDRCNMKNNFICKYSDEKPTPTSTRPEGTRTESTTSILPEDTEKEDAKETFKDNKEAALNLAYILLPSIPLFLLLVVTTVLCWVWICRRRRQEQSSPGLKEPHPTWPCPQQGSSPNLEIYNVIRKQSEADLTETRPDSKNISFRVCSGEATPDDMSCDYDNMAVNPSESGFVTLESMESGFVTNDIYEFSPERLGRSKESGWVENEIYGY